ncbi:MAG: hypothetical protein HYZ38_13190 [Mycobacterium sp.]|nr:hypothetical protein [Mycobacterium sp.]
MGILFRLIEVLIVIVPVIGLVVAGVKAVAAVRAGQAEPAAGRAEAAARVVRRTVAEHDRTDTRWLDYELDMVKLLDFPLMTDMRDPLTVRFHRAKVRADLLRPAAADDLLDNRDAARDYRDAVEEYVTAFDVAEAEAIRRRRTYFSAGDQQRVARAQSLLRVAADTAATREEREQAYALARRELDGVIVLPARTSAQIERGIAGELGS